MRAKHAREIRRGARRMPQTTPFGFRDAPELQLWERAFHHTFKPSPPRGGSGVSR